MKKAMILLLVCVAVGLSAFVTGYTDDKPVSIPKTKQRVGNAAKGYEYLVTGDYVKGGIPLPVFLMGAGKQKILLPRSGDNAKVPHDFTVVTATNGERIVAPNCLQCHAQVFDEQLVIGLGNSLVDFTPAQKFNASNIGLLEKFLKNNPKQAEASASFLQVTKTISPFILVENKGVNVADRLAAVLVAHRDPTTFKWSDEAQLEMPTQLIPTDTPPWWLLKRKMPCSIMASAAAILAVS